MPGTVCVLRREIQTRPHEDLSPSNHTERCTPMTGSICRRIAGSSIVQRTSFCCRVIRQKPTNTTHAKIQQQQQHRNTRKNNSCISQNVAQVRENFHVLIIQQTLASLSRRPRTHKFRSHTKICKQQQH